jgi:thioredoxin-related protein/YHS domain-containing protein
MRTPKPIVLSAWLALALAGSIAAQDRIPWVTDLKVARQMAEQQQRLVLLHFWSETCVPCQQLERRVFNQPEFIRAISGVFVPVKINIQQAPDLASYYKVTTIPTDIIVDASGKEIFRGASPQDATAYIGVLDAIKAHRNVGQAVPTELLATASRMFNSPWQQTSAPTGDGSSPYAQPAVSNLASPQEPASPATTMPSSAPAEPAYVQNPYTNPAGVPSGPQAVPAYAPQSGNTTGPTDGSAVAASGPAPNLPNWQIPSGAPAAPQLASAASAPSSDRLNSTLPAFSGSRPSGAPDAYSAPNNAAPAPDFRSPVATANEPPQWNMNSVPAGRPWNAAPSPGSQPTGAAMDPQAALRSTPPSLPAPATNQPPLALDGYCPVSLVEQSKWSKGDPRWGAVHRGRVYLFGNSQAQQAFLANPDHFSPLLAGHDAVRYAETGQLVEGKREHGVYYRDRILLFADEDALQRFGTRPEYYVATAEQMSPRNTAGPSLPPTMPNR